MEFRIIALVVSLISVFSVSSQDVTLLQAQNTASHFFQRRGIASDMPVRQKAQSTTRQNEQCEPYYIFNSTDSSAFVVVSGDYRTDPILAYSTEGAFDQENISPGAAYMLEQYDTYIRGLSSAAHTVRAAIDFGEGKLIETAKWNQSHDFWWDECPKIGDCHTYAGCVATAMAILMRHYQWPPTGFGSKSYVTETNGLNLQADFTELNYDWASLPKGNEKDTRWSTQTKSIVAKLLYQCGVASNMDYGVETSSTSSIEGSCALMRYFGYTMGNYILRDSIGDLQWYSYIKDEIDTNNPVLYRGEKEHGAGHAFICDGYDGDGLLHFNFGWSGSNNGYYSILTSDMSYGFKQAIELGVKPDYDAPAKELPDVYLAYRGDYTTNGFTIQNDGLIHRGQRFYVKLFHLYNVTNEELAFSVAAYVCDAEGNPKFSVGEYEGLKLNAGSSYNWARFKCSLPYDYEVCGDDYLMLFSHKEGDSPYLPVGCSALTADRILIQDVYDATPLHLSMVEVQDKDSGLVVQEGYNVNCSGINFKITANCLENIVNKNFTGEVAAFVCDKDGNQKMKIGTSNMNGLQPWYYYTTWNITCGIQPEDEVIAGDKICIFSKMDGESDWGYVTCFDPAKEYIEISAEMLGEADIQDIVNDNTSAGAIYNMQGMKVDRITHNGIYIINGKKVIR